MQCFWKISTRRCLTYSLFVQKSLKTILKQTIHRVNFYFDVYESPSVKDSTRQERGDDRSERQFSIGSQQKMPSDFDQLKKLSCFKKELLRFFYDETQQPCENISHCTINIEYKKLYCKNDNC